jgi:hypothetical protein
MNWSGRLIQDETGPDDTVLDLGCGIMANILDHVEGYRDKRRLKCGSLTGVDFFQPYLDWLNENYPDIKTVRHDLGVVPYPFLDRSQDVVVLSDIVEHMKTMDDVDGLLNEAERIARKKVLVLTPVDFVDNVQAVEAWDLGENEGQRHHVKITSEYLRARGYQTNFQAYGVDKWGGYTWAVKKVGLKILHIGDVAGVSSVMSKYQKRLGHDVRVIVSNHHATPHWSEMYGTERLVKLGPVKTGVGVKLRKAGLRPFSRVLSKIVRLKRHLKFCSLARDIVIEWDPDVVHVHSLFLFPFFIPFHKKMIIEWHGTEVRDAWADGTKNTRRRVPLWAHSLFRFLKVEAFISTPDLFDEIQGAVYIENPVDVEHFSPRKMGGLGALYVHNGYETEDWARSIAKKYGWPLDIQERQMGKPGQVIIHHGEYPEFLARYDTLIDRHNVVSLSRTAMEFLAMGGQVVRWDGKIIEGLPPEHEPMTVARKTISIYRDILGPDL